MIQKPQAYDHAEIRGLLLAAFTAEALARFCRDRPDLRPIVNRFGLHHGFDEMVDEVIDYCEAHVLFADLLIEIHRENPRQHERFGPYLRHPSKVFLCYKRKADPDQRLADHLHQFLVALGHEVFMDTTLRAGVSWLEEIDQQIQASDFLVVLLSQESADSEMVQAEVRRAYGHRKLQGHPRTLPVRIAYEGLLPYSIDSFLDPVQYVLWQGSEDDDLICQEVLAALEGHLEEREPVQIRPGEGRVVISEDGRPVADDEAVQRPLPEFDPRFLQEMEAPGGAVKLRDKLYVRRQADARLEQEVMRTGTTTTIRAARQTGKSSLLVRGMHHARQHGARVVCLDVQRVASERLASPEVFLRDLAELVVRKLHLDVGELDKIWAGSLGPQEKLTYVLEDYVLSESTVAVNSGIVVLALDEADRLLQTEYYQDFFALVRSWHNNRAYDDRWDRLNVVMVISTEPYLLIRDVTQSPFNVGLKLYLQDFDKDQVRGLNECHGSPVRDRDFSKLMDLFGGHPYLTRKALYTLVVERLSWADLLRLAPTDHGPFGDHLRRHHWLLRDKPDLRETLREVIQRQRCLDEMAFFRLLQAGLVKGSGDVCSCRCDLYRIYFEDKLK